MMNKSVGISVDDKKVGDAQSFLGFSGYINYAAAPNFTLAARYENFNDSKEVALLGAKINAVTLSGNIKIDALTIIPEVRFDAADIRNLQW
ncbi:MAG: outer membrane beta-barrel protein [Saprospiraceae bacterium]|nr:outer membrane beta-barrel protein [Saprospiraceae bacterium]